MPGPLVGLAVRGAGMALRGVGKALMKGGKSLTKAGSKRSQAQRRKFRRRRGKSTNDPALSTALTFTGAAGAGLLGKKIMDDRKKNRTGGR